MLRLPRPQSTSPATKSSLRGPHEIYSFRLTKCCARREICTSGSTKCCPVPGSHKALHLPRNQYFKVRKVLHLPRNLHSEIPIAQPCQGDSQQKHFQDKIKMPKCSVRLRLPFTSENEPHVQKSRFTAPATKLPCAPAPESVQ